MAYVAPNIGELWIALTGGAKAKLIKLVKWDYHETAATLDTSNCDGNGWAECMAGDGNFSVDVSARWETTEGKLFGVPPVIAAKNIVDFQAYLSKTALPNENWAGSGMISDVTVGVDHGSGEGITYTFTITGFSAPTRPAAA